MAELLAQAGEVKTIKKGQTIEATIIEKLKNMLLLDVGGKGEAIISDKAFEESKDYIKMLKVGDRIKAYVLVPETPDGYVRLSVRDTAQDHYWEKIEEAKKNKLPVIVFGKLMTGAGITVDVDGLTGFIPATQLGKAVAKRPKKIVGSHFKAVVLEADRSENRLVLSEKEVSEKEDIERISKAIASLKEGDKLDGKVTTVASFGCFVEVFVEVGKKKVRVEGLVHISEISWQKTDDPSTVLSVGEKTKVRVIGKKDGKLALSIRQAGKDPWEEADERYKKETKVKGRVTKQSDFGVFVELEPGIEGLVHITKIPPAKRFEKGEIVDVYVEDIDTAAKRVSLGLILTAKPVGYK